LGWGGGGGPALDTGQISALQAARDAGVAAPDEIASAYYPDSPARQRVAAAYLRDNIKYRLGADERAGLELFYRYAAPGSSCFTATPPRRAWSRRRSR
jgi:predicted solute-binding protein